MHTPQVVYEGTFNLEEHRLSLQKVGLLPFLFVLQKRTNDKSGSFGYVVDWFGVNCQIRWPLVHCSCEGQPRSTLPKAVSIG